MASSPRSRLSREDRMEQMLDRAHNLFAERGYAAVTMDEIAAENPQHRLIQPGEIAQTALFLCSEAAKGITMEEIRITGGALW